MVWLDNILDLQFYNPPPGNLPCYCEQIIFPYTMVLQGSWVPLSGDLIFYAETRSPDGLIFYEDVTANFEVYFFQFNGLNYFNARLKYFADSMCVNPCYILRVAIFQDIYTVFNKYTERYCQTTCCDLATGIDITQDGLVAPTPSNPVLTNYTKVNDCGDVIITLTSTSDCYDNFTGDFYGIPTNILSGSATFSFYKFTNMKGRLVPKPRELTRQYSFNCNIQKVETKRVYLLEAYEYFPAWKVNEIEGQLLSKEIYVEGRRFEYAGGVAFKQLTQCAELFKLETTLEDCTVRQIYGCGVPCGTNNNYDGAMAMFVIPSSYADGNFYDETGVVIATDYEGLLDYIRNMDGMYEVTDLTPPSGFGCDVFAAFSFSGNGYLPGSIFFDNYQQGNRVYSVVLSSSDDICGQVGTECAAPVLGSVTVTTFLCDEPVIGTIVITEITPTAVGIEGTLDWALDGSEDVQLFADNTVDMHFKVGNPSIPEDPDYPGVPVYITYQHIATVGSGGRPQLQLILNEDNAGLPSGVTLTINTNGSIYYDGYATESNATQSNIEIDIIYTI